MKVEKIEIAGFGALRDLVIDLDGDLTLFHGHNEAGKSTLMNFIRSVLFGFPSRTMMHERYEPESGGAYGGALQLRGADGRLIRVERLDGAGLGGRRPSGGVLSVTMDDGTSGGEELLKQVIGDITSDLFRNIFAFSLSELQEIRTLQSDEIGSYLFNTGMGISGTAIIEAEKKLGSEMDALFKPRGQKQALNVLTGQAMELEAQIRRSRESLGQYQAAMDQLNDLDQEIHTLEQDLDKLERELAWISKGMQAQEPWLRLRTAELELHGLPIFGTFPEDALRRYEDELHRLDELTTARETQLARLQELADSMDDMQPDMEIIRRKSEIATIYGSIATYKYDLDERHNAETELMRVAEQVREWTAKIDPNWSEENVQTFSTSLGEEAAVDEYQEQLETYLRKKEELAADMTRLKQAKLRALEQIETNAKQAAVMRERMGQVYADGLIQRSTQDRRRSLQQLKTALDSWHHAVIASELGERNRENDVKRGTIIRTILVIVGILNVLLPVLLYVVGEWISAIVLFVILAGVNAGMFLVWNKLKGSDKARKQMIGEQELERRAREVAVLYRGISGEDAEAAAMREQVDGGNGRLTIEAGDLLYNQMELALEQLQEDEAKWRQQDDRLAEQNRNLAIIEADMVDVENHVNSMQAKYEECLKSWQSWLADRKLADHLSPRTVKGLFEVVRQAKQLLGRQSELQQRMKDYGARILAFEKQVAELSGSPSRDHEEAVNNCRQLKLALDHAESIAAQLAAFREQYKEGDLRLQELDERIKLGQSRIAELWNEAGTEGDAEFRQRVAQYSRSHELQQEIHQSVSQLEWLVGRAEVDKLRAALEQTDSVELEGKRDRLREEVQLRKSAVNEKRDKRGELRNVVDKLREGAEHADLLQRQQEVLAEMKKQAAKYAVAAISEGLLRKTREMYEQERQPEVLKSASRYLATITGGAYTRIAAPFGERKLLVERNDGRMVDTAYLSRGTAEQLYLAMRFALADAYASRSVCLPIVLDDIFVNFDSERLGFCMDVLQVFCERHQVLLFTCHDFVREHAARRLANLQLIPLRR